MRIKKFLAVLLSAALALTLFAGCGGNPSLRRLLLELFQGQYYNVTIKAGPAMEDILRQAVNQGDTLTDIDNALEDALQPTVSFDSLWNATSQDNAYDLAYYPGGDAQSVAHLVYTEWDTALAGLPSGSSYVADFAAIAADNGYYVLMSVAGGDSDTVANSDGGNDGTTNAGVEIIPGKEEPKPEGTAPDAVPPEGYWSNNDSIYVVYNNTGLKNLFFGSAEEGADETLAADRDSGFRDKTIKLKKAVYQIDQKFEGVFNGTLTSEDPDNPATIQLTGEKSLFKETNAEISHIRFEVTQTVGVTLENPMAGVVADENNGLISDCSLTFDGSTGIEVTGTDSGAYIGGFVGRNGEDGIIEKCKVSGGLIKLDAENSTEISIGGIAGLNMYGGTVRECSVSGSKFEANLMTFAWNGAAIGGVIGQNQGTVENLSVSGNDITVTFEGEKLSKEDYIDYLIMVGDVTGYSMT